MIPWDSYDTIGYYENLYDNIEYYMIHMIL